MTFLEVAISAGIPLITGNRADFAAERYPDVRIYTPGQFIKLIALTDESDG